MFFIVEKPRLQRIIAIVRDDRTPKLQGSEGSFMRIEAHEDHLKLDGALVSATIPATVYESGVLFLRITCFRRLLHTIKGQKALAIQVNEAGLLFDNITMALEPNDMLLYPDPAQAPRRHPDDVSRDEEEAQATSTSEIVEDAPTADALPLWDFMGVEPETGEDSEEA